MRLRTRLLLVFTAVFGCVLLLGGLAYDALGDLQAQSTRIQHSFAQTENLIKLDAAMTRLLKELSDQLLLGQEEDEEIEESFKKVKALLETLHEVTAAEQSFVESDDLEEAVEDEDEREIIALLESALAEIGHEIRHVHQLSEAGDSTGAMRLLEDVLEPRYDGQFAALLADQISDEDQEIAAAEARMNDLFERAVLKIVGCSTGVLAVLLLVAWTTSRSITGRLFCLSAQAERFGRGQEVTVVAEKGADEISRLIRSFASMVSDRKQAELQLRDAKATAEAANRSKSEFVANMSHEIRTPMTAILGFAEVLLEQARMADEPPEQLEAAETIKRNGEYLLSIINDILDCSKIEAGKMTVELIPISVCKLITETMSLASVPAKAKRLPVEVEYEGPIPETIRSDPTRLRQILLNLLANAIKFTESGGVRLLVRLVADRAAPYMQFDVVDTGAGMKAEQVARLFQPFTQAESSTTRIHGGTGLGLPISKQLAALLGGDVTLVETRPGGGTRFRVTVATGSLDGVKLIDDPQCGTTTTGRGDEQPGERSLDLRGCRVLLAEDGPDNQRLLGHVLGRAGARVETADNGQTATAMALAAQTQGTPYHIILMDMQMPLMDGYQATRLLRQKGYTGPIIALTAHAMATDRQKCLEAGCDDYASKPINRQALIDTILSHTATASA